MSLPYEGELIEHARELRKNATKQENHLWYDFLRNYSPRFQRQKTIGNYIADFYCHAARLVIELDGSQHFEEAGERYDTMRTEFLRSQGLDVLRIANIDIDRHFFEACEMIDATVKTRL